MAPGMKKCEHISVGFDRVYMSQKLWQIVSFITYSMCYLGLVEIDSSHESN